MNRLIKYFLIVIQIGGGFMGLVFVLNKNPFDEGVSLNMRIFFALFACIFVFARQSIANIRLTFSLSAWKTILAAALPLSITAVRQTIIVNTDIVMLGLMAGNEPTGLDTGAFRLEHVR